MKKILIGLLLLSFNLFSQKAKKPTLIVLPSNSYLEKNGFGVFKNTEDGKLFLGDYSTAFIKDRYLRFVVAGIAGFLAREGFPVKDAEQNINTVLKRDVYLDEEKGKDNSGIKETNKDKILSSTKADIVINVDFYFNQNGPRKSLVVNLKGMDAYTDKQIADDRFIGEDAININAENLFNESNYPMMSNFTSRLQAYFDDMFANGREVTLGFKITNNSEVNFETEYQNEKEFSEIIEDWLTELSQEGRFNITDKTETMIFAEQVRIPVLDQNQKALDSESFLQIFRKRLAKPPYNLQSRVSKRGLGESWLIINSK